MLECQRRANVKYNAKPETKLKVKLWKQQYDKRPDVILRKKLRRNGITNPVEIQQIIKDTLYG